MKKILIASISLLSLTSCYVTKSYVGNVKSTDPVVPVNKVTNNFLFWGLAPLSNNIMKPEDYVKGKSNYVIEHKQSFVNGLLSAITIGIYAPMTTTFYLPVDESK
ncbi:MAG: hypothetical protein DI598_01820 [Pseudopedobacter saltans]|uniref:Bor protein n=1 Tax=Pseudopedobacter saltans TaxID=151895 RepID=A0A2W5FCJ2_9SPHI|nr:MAG: hypothetical protein DI598_01820 [Pseudopedobacter saltans]